MNFPKTKDLTVVLTLNYPEIAIADLSRYLADSYPHMTMDIDRQDIDTVFVEHDYQNMEDSIKYLITNNILVWLKRGLTETQKKAMGEERKKEREIIRIQREERIQKREERKQKALNKTYGSFSITISVDLKEGMTESDIHELIVPNIDYELKHESIQRTEIIETIVDKD